MNAEHIFENALKASKFVTAPDNVKLDIFSKYSLMADAVYGGAGFDLIKNNVDTFQPLLSKRVTSWAMTEKGKPIYTKAVQLNPRISKVFSSSGQLEGLIKAVIKETGLQGYDDEIYENVELGLSLFGIESAIDISDEEAEINGDIDDIGIKVDFDNTDDLYKQMYGEEEEEEPVKEEKVEDSEVAGYIDKIHGGYRKQIEAVLISAWEDMYGYHVDGKEIVDGFIVPGGAILGTGETMKYEGVLTLATSKVVVKPNTMSNAVYDEFVLACHDCGVPLIREVADNQNEVKPYKYNPLLQRLIASGGINRSAFKEGWASYSKALTPFITKKTKELAVIKSKTGSDEEIYKALSGYLVSLMAVNYKDELGTQIRVCCGDTSKTLAVAKTLVVRLRAREKTNRSIAQGKLVVGDAIVSDSGLSATITVYQNMAGYQAVPQFMGELLCNLNVGMFKPSLDKMIIGLDMKNNIVTAPFNKWLVPIIAGSRSGKGVLTLNMLLNVIGGGTPLFYLDGKPDMAALLWKLQKKYNIKNSMVVDGIGYKGTTDIDLKPYEAPYASNMTKALQSEKAHEILETNYGVVIYLKTMLVIMLSCAYYKDKMGSKYGDIFVVFDEVFKVIKVQLEALVLNIDTELAKLDKGDKEKKAELNKIKLWASEILSDYIGKDIGVFGAGIKAVALTQFSQVTSYGVTGLQAGKIFCENFLLKRGVKLFGRQEGGSGMYGMARDKGDEINFDLYDKYFHFGIGTEQGNTYNGVKTFKPLLVLNENDCKEMTGADTDGAFTSDMLSRVAKYTDVDQFREKYFGNKELSESIGFEGALAQVGRLLEVDWKDMLDKSLSRSYEIADEALRYYGVIGVEGIDNVHDYICSFNIEHLWSYNQIVRAKNKGISLGNGSLTGEGAEGEEGESLFQAEEPVSEDDGDDIIDFGHVDESTVTSEELGYGGKVAELSAEELKILTEIKERREEFTGNIEDETIEDENIEDENIEDNTNEEYEQTMEDITAAKIAEEYGGNYDEWTVDEKNFLKQIHQIRGSNNSDIGNENIADNPDEEYEQTIEDTPQPKPAEVYSNADPVFVAGGNTGKKILVTPKTTTNAMKLTPENSIIANLSDSHPLEKFESRLMKTLKGSNYEFSRRWDAVLSAISKKINSNLITRVMLVQDEMYVNGRLISMVNIVGGFENIRLEDLVDYKVLFKTFRNITELTLDTTMVERFQIEQPSLPVGFFVYSEKLQKVNILLSNGRKEVIDRQSQTVNEETEASLKESKLKSQFEAVCASKNPRLKDKSAGYQNQVWKSTKSFGGANWEAINKQIRKENPSFMKALGIGMFTLPIVAVGTAAYGIGSLFSLFKR